MANLTQMKILEGLDGFLLVDKPVNIPFASVVKTVKRKFGLIKVGHGGSLDAQASGLMVLLIGDANKFTDQVMGGDREYEGKMDASYVTNTGDAWGEKLEKAEVRENSSSSTADDSGFGVDLKEFKGDVFQTEPQFAAIRKEGTADYEVVDTGEHKQFLGHVYKIEVKSKGEKGKSEEFDFFLRATKNVLPRALAKDMGATLTELRRTKQWKFEVKDAVPFQKILDCEPSEFPSLVKSIGEALRSAI